MFKQSYRALCSFFSSLAAINFLSQLMMRLFVGGTLLVAGLLNMSLVTIVRDHLVSQPVSMLAYFEVAVGALLILGLMTRLASLAVIITTIVVAIMTSSWSGVWAYVVSTDHSEVSGFISTLFNLTFWMKNPGDMALANIGVTTIFIMSLSLYFTGAGSYLSLDYYFGSGNNGAARSSRNTEEVDSNRLYVGNLDYSVDRNALKALFAPFGDLVDVKLLRDPNGKSKCYAFVTFKDINDAKKAQKALSGKMHANRPMVVKPANKR